MTWLATGDLHLTDRPRDAYRFGLFKWLAKQQEKYDPQATFILGDLTDFKDHHSSKLVNRLVEGLLLLKPPIFILRGNHDGIDPTNPYFKFLSHIEGLHFVVHPTEVLPGVHLIPHQREQAAFDQACAQIKPVPTALMVHQTFDGSIAESGARLTGLAASPIELLRPALCWAGDVHKPQRSGPVTYLGAPYHVRFGDVYDPRVMLLHKGAEKNLYFDCLKKWSLSITDADGILANENLIKGDQVKLTVRLTREEAVEWPAHRQRCVDACKKLGLEIHGLDLEMTTGKRKRAQLQQRFTREPRDVVLNYCKAENLSTDIRNVGLALLED